MPPSIDVASIDQAVAVDQRLGLDASKGEALPPVDVLPTVDTSADRPNDIATGIDAVTGGTDDAPQLNLDAGVRDTGSVSSDANDAATVDAGGIDAELHPIDEFPMPTKGNEPYGWTLGSDDNLWFCEGPAENIGRISSTGAIKEFPLPGGCSALVAGPDKNVWFGNGNLGNGYSIGRIVPTTGEVVQFPPSEFPIDFMTVGPDSNVWFTSTMYRRLGKVTPSGVIIMYPVKNSPTDIVKGPDGHLWYGGDGVVARVDGELDGQVEYTEFPVPTINGAGGVAALTNGGDGRFWYTYNDFNHRATVGAMTTTGATVDYVVSEDSVYPRSIAKGSDGNVWFTDNQGIARITPSGQVTEFSLPSSKNTAADITLGPDGNLWFVDSGTNTIGRLTIK
jgi:streptogramin lyase